jgi:hypothetical protein
MPDKSVNLEVLSRAILGQIPKNFCIALKEKLLHLMLGLGFVA